MLGGAIKKNVEIFRRLKPGSTYFNQLITLSQYEMKMDPVFNSMMEPPPLEDAPSASLVASTHNLDIPYIPTEPMVSVPARAEPSLDIPSLLEPTEQMPI